MGRSYFFVNQSRNFSEDNKNGEIQAPIRNRAGNREPTYERILEVKKGDIIFSKQRREWEWVLIAQENGHDDTIRNKYCAKVKYIKLDNKYDLKNRVDDLRAAFTEDKINFPFDKNGNYKEVYLYKLNDDAVNVVFDELKLNENKLLMLANNGGTNIMKIEDYIKEAINNNKKQIVLTGAPGTGKTYAVRDYVEGIAKDRFKFVQFHPSYDYSDFVEGLRPVQGKNGMEFVKLDGVFKEFCRKIVEENYKNTFGNKASDILAALESLEKNEIDEKLKRFDEGLDDQDNEVRYFFIIDEINRADLSKVFGELMFGLEESYRGYKNRFDTQYKNLPTYEVNQSTNKEIAVDCFKNGFFIPKNLYIIGTMNDIDKSVEAFDFALRRRFEWIEIKANDVMESAINNIVKISNPADKDVLIERAKKLNDVISGDIGKKYGLNESYHIGPAYYKGVTDLEDSLKNVFEHNIESILKEYTRGRDSKDLVDECRKVLKIQ